MWRVRALFASLAVACADQEPPPEPPAEPTLDDIPLGGVDGCNCAGASPAMSSPSGDVYPFQSIVAYYYEVLEAFWERVDDEDLLVTWLPPAIEATSEAFFEWQAKTVQIYHARHALGYSNRFYRGIFGLLRAVEDGTCYPALDPASRTLGMLAHIGLSQAGVCGMNDDGTTKFWQVNHISLLQIGEVYDAYELVDAGLAEEVTSAPADRCILPLLTEPYYVVLMPSYDGASPVIPCRVAFRTHAVTEGVVLPVPTMAMVDGVPLRHRGFTAAGAVAMPNALDEVRTILRSDQLRAMFAIGVPIFMAEPYVSPTAVRLIAHRIGPAISPSSILLPEERQWVDAHASIYASVCCRTECEPILAALGSGSGSDTGCQTKTTCIPEGKCLSGTIGEGLVVMVSAFTTKECFGSCPEPATDTPAEYPVCIP